MISPQEMKPLSPEVEDKRIEVDTKQQMVYANVWNLDGDMAA